MPNTQPIQTNVDSLVRLRPVLRAAKTMTGWAAMVMCAGVLPACRTANSESSADSGSSVAASSQASLQVAGQVVQDPWQASNPHTLTDRLDVVGMQHNGTLSMGGGVGGTGSVGQAVPLWSPEQLMDAIEATANAQNAQSFPTVRWVYLGTANGRHWFAEQDTFVLPGNRRYASVSDACFAEQTTMPLTDDPAKWQLVFCADRTETALLDFAVLDGAKLEKGLVAIEPDTGEPKPAMAVAGMRDGNEMMWVQERPGGPVVVTVAPAEKDVSARRRTLVWVPQPVGDNADENNDEVNPYGDVLPSPLPWPDLDQRSLQEQTQDEGNLVED